MKKLICAVAVLSVSTAQADTIYVDANCPGGDGSELDPYCSIQTAIDNAVETDEVVVAPGTYFEAVDFAGKAIILRSSGGAAVTTIDGTGSLHVVTCNSGEGLDSVLDGFTVTGGNADGSTPDSLGGGMTIHDSSPTVMNCVFAANAANSLGGGMAVVGGSPSVTACTFIGNTSTNGGGLASFGVSPTYSGCTIVGNSANLGGGIYLSSHPTFTNCDVCENSASISGGGLYVSSSGNPVLIGCRISDNTASIQGGAIATRTSHMITLISTVVANNSAQVGGAIQSNSLGLTVSGSLFYGNSADVGSGIHVQNSGPLVVTDSVFSMNGNAQGVGAAVFANRTSVLIDRCIFSGNAGGGVLANGDTISVTDSVFTGNMGGPFGGGIYSDGTGVIANCLFVGNVCGCGGGIYSASNAGNLAITNCTFAGNVPAGVTAEEPSNTEIVNCVFWSNSPYQVTNDPAGTPTDASVYFSDVEGGYPGPGSNNIDADPMFPGGLTGTWTGEAVFDPGTSLTTFHDNTASFLPGELARLTFVPLVPAQRVLVVADNTATTISTYGDWSLFGIPGFEYRIDDYNISTSSPCIDAGHNWAIAGITDTDLDGNPRFAADKNDFDPGCGIPVVVDMGAYEYQGDPFPVKFGDTNGDGVVGINDFLDLLADWGPCEPACCLADLDLDGNVGITDFLLLLGNWG